MAATRSTSSSARGKSHIPSDAVGRPIDEQPAAGRARAFVRQAVAGGPIVVHGDGSQTRCFLDARDAAEYVWRLLCTAAPRGLLVNVGWEEPVTILDLARAVRDLVDPSVAIETAEPGYGPGFVPIRHRRPDVRRLVAWTRYRPQVPLAETVRACVDLARARA